MKNWKIELHEESNGWIDLNIAEGQNITVVGGGALEEKGIENLKNHRPYKTIKKLLDAVELLDRARYELGSIRRSIQAHPDCESGSEFGDFANSAQDLENEIEELLK